MSERDENFQYIADTLGEPAHATFPAGEDAEFLEQHLPGSIVAYFRKYGFGMLHDHLFTTCHPKEMRSVLALIFGADRDFSHKTCHCVGYTAFGELHCWSEEFQDFRIDLVTGMIFSQLLAPTRFKDMPDPQDIARADDDRMASGLIPTNRDDVEFYDYRDEPISVRCQELHGRLEPGECYGFFPALAFAGIDSPKNSAENIKRVKAVEHFALLAQLDTFHLTKIGPGGFESVRPVG